MSNLCIITARGGSKRIPRKNIKDFCGKPIISYSIEAALKSGLFDEVMVSTDDVEIAEIAKKYGANIPFFRSESTSDDYATTNDVLNEVLREYRNRGKIFNVIACIYPTAPFVNERRLTEAYSLLIDGNASSIMAAVQYSFPPQRALVVRDGKMVYREGKHKLTRSQDLEPIYHDAGQFYFYRIFNEIEFIDDDYRAVILPETEVQDIDNIVDWELAEMKYRLINEGKE